VLKKKKKERQGVQQENKKNKKKSIRGTRNVGWESTDKGEGTYPKQAWGGGKEVRVSNEKTFARGAYCSHICHIWNECPMG